LGWCISHNAFTSLRCLQERATSLLPDPPSWSSSSLLSSLASLTSPGAGRASIRSFSPSVPAFLCLALSLLSSPSLSAREMGSFSTAGSCRQQRRTRVRRRVCARESGRTRVCGRVCMCVRPCSLRAIELAYKCWRSRKELLVNTQLVLSNKKEKNSQ